MARVYAQAADYQTYTGQTPPTDITALLAQATRFLESSVFRFCYYTADATTGLPTDTAVQAALRDAVCAQVQWWQELGDSIGAMGTGWGDIRIGTVQLSRLSSTKAAYGPEDSPARMVAPQVWDALRSPDLTPEKFRMGMVVGW